MTTMKRLALCATLALAVAAPLLAPAPAQAWWGPRWGWGWGWGWGWRPSFVVAPPVVVGPPAPVYLPPAEGAAATQPYPAPYWRWVPGYFDQRGYWVPSHWEAAPPPPASHS